MQHTEKVESVIQPVMIISHINNPGWHNAWQAAGNSSM